MNRRVLLFVFSIMIAGLCWSQVLNDTIATSSLQRYEIPYKDCKTIKELITTQAEDGNYTIVSYGLIEKPFAIDEAFRRHLLLTYNIKTVVMACATVPSEICYAQECKKTVDQKFGKDFVEKEYEKFKSTHYCIDIP